jgi:hypothetical protein
MCIGPANGRQHLDRIGQGRLVAAITPSDLDCNPPANKPVAA